jgi:hypothetical protein
MATGTNCLASAGCAHSRLKLNGHPYIRTVCRVLVHVNGVRLRLWTAATVGPTIHPPGDIWGRKATVECYWQRKTEKLWENPVQVPLCPPKTPHGLTRERTRTSRVWGRRVTAWAMARPFVGHLKSSYYASRQSKLIQRYNFGTVETGSHSYLWQCSPFVLLESETCIKTRQDCFLAHPPLSSIHMLSSH